ncbi:MAG: DUF4153 domain-containing protein [Bacteroidales bacterium]|nr:DUF4153 domain-containing protein [Bacteroidales bacterium]
MNKIRTLFSLSSFLHRLGEAFSRFPVTILSCLAFMLAFPNTDDEKTFFIGLGSIIISLACSLFCENFEKKWLSHLVSTIGVGLWLSYLYLITGSDYSTGIIIQKMAILSCFVVAIFTVFFYRKQPDDRQFWNFFRTLIRYSAIALLFSVLLLVGILIAKLFIDSLIESSMNSLIFPYIACFCLIFLFPVSTLCYIPKVDEIHNDALTFNKFQKIFSQYLLLPLIVFYFFILYFYLFYIIIRWRLPQGRVTYMVSTSVLCYLLLLYLSYPAYLQGENRTFSFIARFGALFAFPLVILMSVGIGYRISQYGITIYRGYVLVLNIWFYAILLFLFFTKSKKIKWIPLSFALTFLLTSVGPWSISNLTYRHFGHNLITTCEKAELFDQGKIVPEKLCAYNLSLKTEKNDNSQDIVDLYSYLKRNYSTSDLEKLFNDFKEENIAVLDEAYALRYPSFFEQTDDVENVEHLTLPNSTTHFEIADYQYYSTGVQWFMMDSCVVGLTDNGKDFSIPKKEILSKYVSQNTDLTFKGSNYLIVVSTAHFEVNVVNDSLELKAFDGNFFVFYK